MNTLIPKQEHIIQISDEWYKSRQVSSLVSVTCLSSSVLVPPWSNKGHRWTISRWKTHLLRWTVHIWTGRRRTCVWRYIRSYTVPQGQPCWLASEQVMDRDKGLLSYLKSWVNWHRAHVTSLSQVSQGFLLNLEMDSYPVFMTGQRDKRLIEMLVREESNSSDKG
jgi:hypothetical protein